MKKKFLSAVLAVSVLLAVFLFMGIEASAAVITPTVKLNYTSYEFTGRPMGPGLTVTDENGNKLVYNEDYTILYGPGRIEPGTYYVTVSFKGDYEGTEPVVKYFDITESKGIDIKLNYTSYEYTGRPMGPGMKVTDRNGKVLTYKEDYVVEYGEGRILPGTYTIKVILQGDYRGTYEKQFEITGSKVDVKLNYTSYEYTGKPMGPGMKVTDSKGNLLTYKEDYVVDYGPGRIEPGVYTIKIILQGNYCGTIEKQFEITGSKVDVKLNYTSYEYTGRPMGPGMKVTDHNGKVLTYKKDYVVEYGEGRILPGTYTVKVILQGDYCGTVTKQFVITDSIVDVKLNYTSYEFTGSPLGPGMKVTDSKGNLLTYKKDYVIDYGPGRIEPGTYTVKVILQGNYYGTVAKQFSITENKVNVKLNYTSYEYTGRAMGPGMTITDSKGRTLTANKDYLVEYGPGRVYPGTYTIKIYLQGNYRGECTASFYITPQRVDGSSVKASGGRKSVRLTWKTMTTQSDGYQIQYSEYSDFRNPKWIRVSNVNTSSYDINNLAAGTKYYVRIRTYKTVNGTDYCSVWSSSVSAVTERTAILDIAIGELGNTGGRKYWTWAGYSKRVAWCCIFVGWCGNQAGYVDDGVIPVYQAPKDAANWFAKKGQLTKNKNYIPKPGDLIFFDWHGRGYPHHVGIVEKVEGGLVYTVEGNSNDVVKRLSYSIGSYGIYGYATPNY